jgi:hypothetical protein
LKALYLTAVIAVSILLAYVSPFYLSPYVFLLGGAAFGGGYYVFLSYRRNKSGVWEHSTRQYRFFGTLFVYIATFWTIQGIYTNHKEQRAFWVRYEPYISNGAPHGYTLYYLDYPGTHEHVDSPALNSYIADKKPEKVKLVLEVVSDFGKLRSYSILTVDNVPVSGGWIPEESAPPWPALRKN